MTETRTSPATVNQSTVVHVATLVGGHWGINCGAIRFRNTTAATITRRPGYEVTCTKCIKAHPEAATVAVEAVEAPADEPLTFMQRQRLAGKAR